MSNLRYNVKINAPKEKVWQLMLELKTYEEWTGAFHAGSTYIGSWDKGSRIKFVSKEDGGSSGMFSKIAESIPYSYISIEHLGQIVNGQEDTSSEQAKQFIGAQENYRFTDEAGKTTVDVELVGGDMSPEFQKMFDGMWPVALEKLKEICER